MTFIYDILDCQFLLKCKKAWTFEREMLLIRLNIATIYCATKIAEMSNFVSIASFGLIRLKILMLS